MLAYSSIAVVDSRAASALADRPTQAPRGHRRRRPHPGDKSSGVAAPGATLERRTSADGVQTLRCEAVRLDALASLAIDLRRGTSDSRLKRLVDVSGRQPGLLAHWRFCARPDGSTM
jgi:hypothetical protein